MASKSKESTDTEQAPAATEDLAAVNEPTRYAGTTTEDRPQPDFVVATQDLYANGVVAHRAGDTRVPVANVERHGWGAGTRPLD